MTCTSCTLAEYVMMGVGSCTDATWFAPVCFDEPILIRRPKALNRMLWRIAPHRDRCRRGDRIRKPVPRILPRGRMKAREQIARGIV